MIHVATVHWRTDRWIDVQRRHLEANAGDRFRVYAFLGDLPVDRRREFHYASTEPIPAHATKLGLLADVISFAADPGDLLVFLDGDAFPIAPLAPFLRDVLARYPLAAIQRLEDNGARQPHPSFCATTVGFWKDLGADWHRGRTWTNAQGQPVSDVGGNLLGALEDRGIAWHAMRRVNARERHPLLFGIYDRVIYHHGAGFRAPLSEADVALTPPGLAARLFDRVPRRWFLRALRDRFHPVNVRNRSLIAANQALSDLVHAEIVADPGFYRWFLGED